MNYEGTITTRYSKGIQLINRFLLEGEGKEGGGGEGKGRKGMRVRIAQNKYLYQIGQCITSWFSSDMSISFEIVCRVHIARSKLFQNTINIVAKIAKIEKQLRPE